MLFAVPDVLAVQEVKFVDDEIFPPVETITCFGTNWLSLKAWSFTMVSGEIWVFLSVNVEIEVGIAARNVQPTREPAVLWVRISSHLVADWL